MSIDALGKKLGYYLKGVFVTQASLYLLLLYAVYKVSPLTAGLVLATFALHEFLIWKMARLEANGSQYLYKMIEEAVDNEIAKTKDNWN